MASVISVGTTTSSAFNVTPDTSGVLQFQTNGTTPAMTISASQVVTLANALPVGSGGTGLTSYTANGVLYASGTGTIATGSTLNFDGTNLFLGTTNNSTFVSGTNYVMNAGTGLANKLSFTVNNSAVSYVYANASATAIGYPSGGTLQFQLVGGGTQATLDSSGNLGLGVTPSAWSGGKAIQIYDASFSSLNGNDTEILTNSYYNAGFKYYGNGFASRYCQISGAHYWLNAPNNSSGAGAAVTFTQAMTLDASGRLGIGTTSPAVKLQIGDNTTPAINLSDVSGNVKAQLIYRNSTTGNLELTNTTAAALVLGTNNTEAARIDSSGNLLVGTTSGIASARVSVQNNGTNSGISVKMTNTGAAGVDFFYNSSEVGYIVVNSSSVTYSTTSDIRLKNDQGIATQSRINNVKIHNFSWKVDGSESIGVFAQELINVIPEAVTKGKDELNEQGLPTNPWGVDYSKLVPDLIVAIQELSAQVTTLQTQVTALQAKVGV